MNWTLFMPAHNCCDINVCRTSCMVVGRPTVLGFIFIVLLIFILSMLLHYGYKLIVCIVEIILMRKKK